MISDHDMRERIELVANGDLSLNDFEDWFVEKSRNMHRDSSPEAIDLAESIHLLLSERDDRILDEVHFLKALVSLLASVTYVTVLVGEPNVAYYSGRWSSRPSRLSECAVQG
jgi:hypothetical protein